MSHFHRFLLIFSIVLLVGVGGTGFWFYQRNQTSKGDLVLTLLGPDSASAGQEVDYTLRCRNQGKVTIVQPELLFTFPTNAQPIDSKKAIVRKEIDDIYPGQEKVFTFKAHLFGKVGEIEQAQAKINYRLKGLKAYYNSETVLATSINSVPLTFEFDLPDSVPPKEDFQFFLNYASSFDSPLSNLMIQFTPPADFQFVSSQPQGLDNQKWNLPLLLNKQGGQIKIKGMINQETGADELFRAQIGVWVQDHFVPLKEIQQTVKVAHSPLYLSQQVNGQLDYIANPGDLLHYQIFFRNIGDYPLEKQFLVVKLDGSQFDLSTVRAPDGLYQPGDNSILWDWKTHPKLRFLDKQDEGSVEFWVNLKKDWKVESESPVVNDIVSIDQSRRVFPIKINSRLELVQQAYHHNEFFQDKGPIPFVVGQTTDYTIFWRVKNFCNAVRDLSVQTVLPKGIWFNNQVFPEDEKENLHYDTVSGKLIWNIGQLDPEQEATVAFQLSFTPQNQADTKLPLIDTSSVSGVDQWTKATIVGEAIPVQHLSTMAPDNNSQP